MGDKPRFEEAVQLVIDHVHFNKDSRVQVFEVTIRMMGALLSAHQLAVDRTMGFYLTWYKGELLDLARDLADRLMPAFETPTGIPFPRVNLRSGVLPYETNNTCAAGAGTLLLEFGVLSRLTGAPKYEQAAKKALLAVWARRSGLDLVGNGLDVQTGEWSFPMAGIGAGIDSLYEYLFKAYVLFGEVEYLNAFDVAYQAVLAHIRHSDGYIYKNINMATGALMSSWIDSLAAFFPGLQALIGDLNSAIRLHHVYYTVWRRFRALPERFDFHTKTVNIPNYPLRPELIESTYMLYQATRNPYYLEVGETLLNDIEAMSRVDCGYAALADVSKGLREDRMESFFLSETLKYLYLLFDEDNFVNRLDSNFVFTTEGHFLPLGRQYLSKRDSADSNIPTYVCPRITSLNLNGTSLSGGNRVHSSYPLPAAEVAYINDLVGYVELAEPLGACNAIREPAFGQSADSSPVQSSYRVNVQPPKESAYPPAKIIRSLNGLILDHMADLTFLIRLNSAGDGFLVSKVNDIDVLADEIIQVPLEGVSFITGDTKTEDDETLDGYPSVHLTAYIDLPADPPQDGVDIHVMPAEFGVRLEPDERIDGTLVALTGHSPTVPAQDGPLSDGCDPYTLIQSQLAHGRFVMVSRGRCTFAEKAGWAELAGATGMIVVNTENRVLAMARDTRSGGRGGGDDGVGIPAVMVTNEMGAALARLARAGGDAARDELAGGGLRVALVGNDGVVAVGATGIQIQFGGKPVKNIQVVRKLTGLGKDDGAPDKTGWFGTGNKARRRWGTRGPGLLDGGSTLKCLATCIVAGDRKCCAG
ncbi:alpha mannosidase-like protein [Borealophlyctis nickersoniae]|nr:alpha mannosidase-like protein [Borealophlyctis nickersoniae]